MLIREQFYHGMEWLHYKMYGTSRSTEHWVRTVAAANLNNWPVAVRRLKLSFWTRNPLSWLVLIFFSGTYSILILPTLFNKNIFIKIKHITNMGIGPIQYWACVVASGLTCSSYVILRSKPVSRSEDIYKVIIMIKLS
jgi:hypothetical protein